MTTGAPIRKRETGRQRFWRSWDAYLGFWAVAHPEPMLEAYPWVNGVAARRRMVRRCNEYGSRRYPPRQP